MQIFSDVDHFLVNDAHIMNVRLHFYIDIFNIIVLNLVDVWVIIKDQTFRIKGNISIKRLADVVMGIGNVIVLFQNGFSHVDYIATLVAIHSNYTNRGSEKHVVISVLFYGSINDYVKRT